MIRNPIARGATLVEVMVGMGAGLLLLSALAVLFAGNSAARADFERASQQIENGRFAIDVLRNDIRQAGYYGGLLASTMQPADACVPRTGVPANATTLGWNASASFAPMAIYGYAYGDVPAAETCFTNAKVGSDILILRTVDTQPTGITAVAADDHATDTFLQSSLCTDAAIDPTSKPFVVASGGAGAEARFVLHDSNCASIAEVRKLSVRAYYVGSCSVCSGSGDAIPTLRTIELTGSTTTNSSLVEGIEAMRVEFALDRDQDGVIDAVVRCKAGADGCSLSDWQNVIGVQVHLLARSLSPSPGYVDRKVYDMGLAGALPAFGDGYKRHRFSAMTTAQNRTGPRER